MACDDDTTTDGIRWLRPGMLVRYGEAIARAVSRLVGPHDVEDIVQETYMRVFQASRRQTIRRPEAFMVRTARNLAINRLSLADALNHVAATADSDRDDEHAAGFVDCASNAPTPDVAVASEQQFVVFCRAIRQLPRQCRRAFVLMKVYGLSMREVAARLGITQSTVEKHIAKALVECSRYMKSQGYLENAPNEAANHRGRPRP